MGKRYRLFLLVLIAVGLAISVITATDLCTFGACTEVHKYLLFGISFHPHRHCLLHPCRNCSSS